MKKTLIALAFLAAFAAHATGSGTPGTGNGGGGGGGGGGGAGVGVGIAAARAVAFGGISTAAGGAGGLGGSGGLGGNGFGGTGMGGLGGTGGSVGNLTAGGNTNALNIAGDTYKPAASSAYAPPGSAPRTSCRLFVGLGGSNTSTSLSGGIPVGNDQLCLSGAQFEFMDKVNAMAPNTFLVSDYLRAACKVEGMSETAACKPEAQRAAAALDGRSQATAVASAPLLP